MEEIDTNMAGDNGNKTDATYFSSNAMTDDLTDVVFNIKSTHA